MSEDEYLRLQTVVFRVARAVEAAVPSERTYVLSLGSQQGNAHLHWHIASLPPGTAYEHQQFHALMAEHGAIAWSTAEAEELAANLRAALGRPVGDFLGCPNLAMCPVAHFLGVMRSAEHCSGPGPGRARHDPGRHADWIAFAATVTGLMEVLHR